MRDSNGSRAIRVHDVCPNAQNPHLENVSLKDWIKREFVSPRLDCARVSHQSSGELQRMGGNSSIQFLVLPAQGAYWLRELFSLLILLSDLRGKV
jgi:hypothetical protein